MPSATTSVATGLRALVVSSQSLVAYDSPASAQSESPLARVDALP